MRMRMMMRMKMATRRRGSYAHNFCGNFNNLGEATINLEKEKFFSFIKNTNTRGVLLTWTKKDSDSRKGKHGLTSW